MPDTFTPRNDYATALEAALDYVRMGYGVVPMHSPYMFSKSGKTIYNSKSVTSTGKIALRYLHKFYPLRNESAVNYWFKRFPQCNLQIVTGLQSGIAVLDVDYYKFGKEQTLVKLAELGLPNTRRVSTGNGEHLYFLHPGTSPIPTIRDGIRGYFTLMSDGGCGVVAPLSQHATGNRYEWINPEHPVAMLPESLLKELSGKPVASMLYKSYYFHYRVRFIKFPIYRAYFWYQDWKAGLRKLW